MSTIVQPSTSDRIHALLAAFDTAGSSQRAAMLSDVQYAAFDTLRQQVRALCEQKLGDEAARTARLALDMLAVGPPSKE